MRIFKLGSGWLLVMTLVLCAACASGDGSSDEAASLDYVKPYGIACTQTVCQKEEQDCRDSENQICDDCFNSCSSPFESDPALCASICHDICSTSGCSSCSAPKDECAAQGIRFDAPPLNTEIRDLAARELSQCNSSLSDDDIAWFADFYGRSFRHEYASTLEFILAKGCDAPEESDTFAANGSVGTTLCARQQACGASCADADVVEDAAAYIDGLEPILRPALVAELARCSRESDCAVAIACWNALKPAVGLARYPTPT